MFEKKQYLVFVVLSVFALKGFAAEVGDKVSVHGFGGWGFGLTDDLRYLVGTSDGKSDNVQVSLNINAQLSSRLKIVTQIAFDETNTGEAELDYAFSEWTFRDELRVRAGRVKHPFGIYGEIFDVGTLRPFFLLPQSIYGPQGITAKSYDGLGLVGFRSGESWGVGYDLYAGEIRGIVKVPGALSADPANRLLPETISEFKVNDVLGARINVQQILGGLSFGVSGYLGQQVLESVSNAQAEQDYEVFGAHFEYSSEKLLVRAEVSTFETETFGADGSYLEIAYRWTPQWQMAVRYDLWEGDELDFEQLPPFADQFVENKDLGFALNYWVSPNLVVRAEFHRVEGNRFAFADNPIDILEIFQSGVLEEETSLYVLAAQFSF